MGDKRIGEAEEPDTTSQTWRQMKRQGGVEEGAPAATGGVPADPPHAGAEAKAKIETVKEQHQKMLKEKDLLLKKKEPRASNEAESSASLQAMQERYEKMLEEKELLLKNKDTQMVSKQQQLQEAQLAELQEKDGRVALQLADQLWRRLVVSKKESEMQLEMSRKEKLRLPAAGALRNDLSSLQGQLKEKEGTLRETIQSLQLLQNNSSDQLRLEQQRVQKLETEVEDLRNRSVAQLQKLEHAEAELGTTRQQVSDLRQALQRLESEKELQAERASERQAALQEQIIKLNLRSKASEEATGTAASDGTG
eukprot:s2563_g1.t1